MSHAPADTRADARQADDAQAFRHLLHEVASHVTGLGLTLDMLGEPATSIEDTTAMVITARGSLDDLRHLISDVGELTRFLHRHGPLNTDVVAVTDLLTDLEQDGIHVCAPTPALPAIRADRVVIGFTLQHLVKACRRVHSVEATASAAAVGAGLVGVDVCVAYGDQPGGRRALEKAPMVVDHFCAAVARDLGGQFVREQSTTGQRVGFVLPVAGA